MMTLDLLKAWGADTTAGLARCMNNEAFYLRLVGMELNDANFAALDRALAAQDMRAAFEAAHALKGATGNLGLSPLYTPVCELTELLRNADAPVGTGDLPGQVQTALAALKALAE